MSKSKVQELQAVLEKKDQELRRLREDWMEALQEKSQLMGASMENLKLRKQLSIIEHISAGRKDEAIAALLDPAQLCINIKVAMDEPTHHKAQEELLSKVVGIVSDHLATLKVKKQEK